MKRALAAALCCLVGVAHAAQSDHHSVSYSIWTVSGSSVLLKILLPVDEAQRLLGADVPLLTTKRLGDYVLRHTAVQAGGRDCPAVDQGYDLGRVDPLAVGPNLYGFELLFRCPAASSLTLHDHVLFERVVGHINFARIEKDGHAAEQLFTADRQRLQIPDSGALPEAGIGSYIRLGAMHLLHSLDRLCILFGSLLLVRRRRDAALLAAGLVAGYVAALAVSAGGWILPRMWLLEAFMGFMVALLAAVITLRELRQARVAVLGCPGLLLLLTIAAALMRLPWQALTLCGAAVLSGGLLAAAARFESPRTLWIVPATLIGFLDGFVLPSLLAPLPTPHSSQLRMVTGFDLGAASTAVLLIGLLVGAVTLASRRRLAPPRQAANEIAATVLGGIGAYWLVSRLIF